MTVLVTGGAGYIGSHVVRLLKNRGDEVVVIDDLSEGFQARIGSTPLLSLDLSGDDAIPEISTLLEQYSVTSVVHLAARKKVGESVLRPDWYERQNVGGLKNLLAAMRESQVQELVFSSSAAVYGMPETAQADENTPCKPINPYGQTKLDGEFLIREAATTWGLREVSLRYFNVAGTGWSDLADVQAANLIPIVFNALRDNTNPQVFGNDWPTLDGTCVRDYVHVADLAEAHLFALDYLKHPDRPHDVFNVGTGKGSSVLEVIHTVAEVTGHNLIPDIQPRRVGDPASLSANVNRIESVLGWKAKHNLRDIVSSVWEAKSN